MNMPFTENHWQLGKGLGEVGEGEGRLVKNGKPNQPNYSVVTWGNEGPHKGLWAPMYSKYTQGSLTAPHSFGGQVLSDGAAESRYNTEKEAKMTTTEI